MAKKNKTHPANEWENPRNYPARSRVESAAREVKENPPAILAKTRKRNGKKAAHKQAVAIILSKARRSS